MKFLWKCRPLWKSSYNWLTAFAHVMSPWEPTGRLMFSGMQRYIKHVTQGATQEFRLPKDIVKVCHHYGDYRNSALYRSYSFPSFYLIGLCSFVSKYRLVRWFYYLSVKVKSSKPRWSFIMEINKWTWFCSCDQSCGLIAQTKTLVEMMTRERNIRVLQIDLICFRSRDFYTQTVVLLFVSFLDV